MDTDLNSATGCSVTPSGGATLNGFEQRVRAVVDLDGFEIVSLERLACAGGVFGAPVPVTGVTIPYPVALNEGSGGADAIELAVARAALGAGSAPRLRLVFLADDGDGSDVMASVDGTPGGASILLNLPVQIPALSLLGLGLLVLGLLVLAALAHRRLGRAGSVLAVMLVATAVWAMDFAADGDLSDWAGRAPIAQDPVGDSTSGSPVVDLVAGFAALDGDQLFFRIDVANVESQVPFAAADQFTTVETALLDVSELDGLLANDSLGVPPATLTTFGGGNLGGAVTDQAAGTMVTVGTDGSLTVNADGSFQFQAATGFEGDFTFDYRIENVAGFSEATVTIEVQTPPVAVDDDFVTLIEQILNVAAPGALANDSGLPDPVVASFGGGDLGGDVGDHAAGSGAPIAPDGSVVVNADGSLAFTPPSGFSGDFGFDYRIENAAGDAQATITITVNDPPEITSADSHVCAVGDVCEFSFTAVGVPAPTITLDGGLPAGVTFNAATESLEGIPDAGTGAEYNLTVTANNGINPEAMQAFTLTVNEAPTITSVDNLTCQVGAPCDFTFTADGFPDPTFSLPGLPTGLSLNANTGVLSGTPAADTGAVYNLTLTATNGITPDDDQAFTLTINEAPTITSVDNLTCQVGDPCGFTFTADGFPDPTFGLPGLPVGLSLNATTGALSGTPDVGTGAEYNLTLTAANGVTPDDSQSFTLTINEAPTITSAGNLTCTVGSSCDFTFTADGFPDSTFALPGLPAGLSLDANTGVLSGTPAAGTGAVHNLTLTAMNGIAPDDTQAFTLTINEAPTITSTDNVTCEVGSTCGFTFTADGFPDPTFALPGLPANLNLDANTGVLSGTPDAGTGAVYNLTLTAANGVTPDDSQSFTLTINEAPTANNDPEGGIPGTSSPGSVAYHGTFNTTLNVSAANGVLDNDILGFPQANIASFDATSAGGGSVTLNADGSFGYNPVSGFTGIDSFGYCIQNAGGSVCATVQVAVGQRPSAANATYPQTLIGNVGIDTTVDTGFSVTAGGDAVVLGVAGTTNGDATINANGTFTFNPTAGVTSANGLLEFSVTNGFGTVTATVTLPIGPNRIWFADNSAGAGDGRLATPFNTLAAVATAANAAGDPIFLHTGSGNYTGGITLLNNQRLLGQGASQALAAIASVTPPTDSVLPATGGMAPVIVNTGGNGVTLASGNHLNGVAVGNNSGSGISGTGFGTLTVADVSVAGTGQALALTNGSVTGAGFSSVSSSSGGRNVSLVTVGGTLNLGGGTLSGATNQGFFVDGGTGTISYAGSVSNTSNRVAEIRNKTGGAVTLSGNLISNTGGTGIQVANNSAGTAITFSGSSKALNTGTGAAVTLSGNAGATMTFSNGGLDIDTTSGAGFSATGGGTVNVTGAGNSVNTSTGTGVNIINTTIGAIGVTFESVSANGASNGIVLETTGTTGGFTVTGDGATAGSGGTIQNTTSNGVSLATTQDVALGFMNITGSAVNGIFGSNVTDFTLDNSNVTNNGDAVNEGGLRFDPNLLGTATISNSTITGSAEHNIEIINTSGTLSSLTISDSIISANSETNGSDGLLIETRNTAEATVAVINSTFDDNQSDGIQISAINDSFASLTVNNTTFRSSLDGSPAGSVGARGIVLSASVNAGLTFDIGSTTGNVFENFSPNIGEEAINVTLVSTSTTSALMSGRINNNTFTNSGGAVGIDLRGDGALVMEIDGNTAGTSRQAIDVITGDAAGDAATADVTITNNSLTVAGTTANPNNEAIGWLGDRDTVSCLNVRGNFGDASGTRAEVILDDFTDAAGAVQLESGPTDCGGGACATSQAHLLANNTITDALSSATLVTPGTCATVP